MPKLIIKDLKPGQGNRKQLLWNRLMELNLLIYNIQVNENTASFRLISSEEVIDKLLTNSTKEQLAKDKFEVITPPENSANRTVVIKNIDSLITSLDETTLKEDIERRNEWFKVSEVIKIPTAPKILKLKAEKISMANMALEKGLLIYNQSLPSHFMEREVFVRLIPCLTCYQYDHKVENCPNSNKTICSECASTGHRYRECSSARKKCVNCGENHRTFAARCPIRKQLIREKRKEIRERTKSRSRSREPTSYASVTRGTTANKEEKPQQSGLNREDNVKIVSSITYAHLVEGILPGSFHETVREMYRINGLPEVKFPKYIPPPQINKDQIETELKKMRLQFEKDRQEINKQKEEEKEGSKEMFSQMMMEIEYEKRKRDRTSPPEQQEQRPKVKKAEQTERTLQRPPTPSRPSTKTFSIPTSPPRQRREETMQEDEPAEELPELVIDEEANAEQEQAREKENRRRKFAKHIQEMNFILIKQQETELQRGDMKEINQFIQEGKIKYIYTNGAYKESECKAMWEGGYVSPQDVEIKSVPRDFYRNMDNGMLVRERRSSTGTISKRR